MITQEMTQAVAMLRAGGLVAIPTETVYGLGADAKNESAVRRIFLAKERPYGHPLIVHLANVQQLTEWARDISPEAMRLAEAFWPGPLTLILKKQPQVLDLVTGGQETVGLRIPNHPVALALLRAFGSGVAAPSANKFTRISPTTAAAVRQELGEEVDLILEGGNCRVGLESTIIDMSGTVPVILRPGMVTAKAIMEVLGEPVSLSQQVVSHTRAPGMHLVHYAPLTKTVLVETAYISDYLQSLRPHDFPIALMTHSKCDFYKSDNTIHYVSMPHEAVPYAYDLYQTLRMLDNLHLKRILIEKVPECSEWDAIRDRLIKASHHSCIDKLF
ncbi:MAG: threonylcarbamoyl-AMP synthase [Gammaproteobacteria bacterium]|nr:threonylcarbamoyl-AMP synthase [Gammaproteobacteria bacterium]MCW5582505.1 threonylcarbamoyl-AMP synthase [Gammaproteobacteria bacterium]